MKFTQSPAKVNFVEHCLYCDQNCRAPGYGCQHARAAWQHEYRSHALLLKANPPVMQALRASIQNYSFDHPAGMLQYRGLPALDFYTDRQGPVVGLTPLFAVPGLSEHFGNNIYIKSEGHNPSGCFKDRETALCMLNARRQGYKRAVIFSSGNAAASAAIAIQHTDFHLITLVSGDTYEDKIDYILNHGSDVIVIGDDSINFETGYRLFAKLNAAGEFEREQYDNWSVINPYRVQGDKTTAIEINRQLLEIAQSPVPDYVIVPTANGSCLAGVWEGFKEMHRLGVIDRLPRMVSAGIHKANPVYQAVQSGQYDKPVRCDLREVDAKDARLGSIIMAEEGYDSIEAARAVRDSGGVAVEVSHGDIEDAYQQFLYLERKLAKDENLMPEPASVISIAAIKKLQEQVNLRREEKLVCLVTGSGFKARKKIREIMADDNKSLAMVDEIIARKRALQYPDASRRGRQLRVAPDEEAVREAFLKLKM